MSFLLIRKNKFTWKNLVLYLNIRKRKGWPSRANLNLQRALQSLRLALITYSGFLCATYCCLYCQGEPNSLTTLLIVLIVCVCVCVCGSGHSVWSTVLSLLSTSSRVSLSPAMHRALHSGRLLGNPVALARHHSLSFGKSSTALSLLGSAELLTPSVLETSVTAL